MILLTLGMSTANAQEVDDHKMPPFEMLPKVGEAPKTIYQLEFLTEYQVFDSLGKEVLSGVAEFIDMSPLGKGNYFIKYFGETKIFQKKTAANPISKD